MPYNFLSGEDLSRQNGGGLPDLSNEEGKSRGPQGGLSGTYPGERPQLCGVPSFYALVS